MDTSSQGFLEGEAHFGITEANGGQSYGCFMSLRLRDDDAALIDWLRRYGVNLHDGALPTAMEFFRWRLVVAPATPTQATVYRLFPGGWPAVLAAYEASAA